MTDREKCKLILRKMEEAGYQVCHEDDVDEYWDADDVDYFLANYEAHYLGGECE